ncbi:hypothetical protein BpHYR1_016361 [Brachionus plicatilis]|uniref:Uncharacterized protein n=1 Tax=Brachionus plicatilis TaxID=10195 RepID=A0A3M7PC67_BRAPC|nr:hypothetical protein BpHYR1_016361 [Brachionus plicatilis]
MSLGTHILICQIRATLENCVLYVELRLKAFKWLKSSVILPERKIGFANHNTRLLYKKILATTNVMLYLQVLMSMKTKGTSIFVVSLMMEANWKSADCLSKEPAR